MYFFLFMVTCWTFGGVAALKLSLTANSKVIIEYIQPLILNCTFEVTQADPKEGSKPHFMYISHETEGVIASISKSHPLTVNGKNRFIRADGNLGDGRGNDSFLQVTFKRPSFKQAAAYTCMAHTKNSQGQDNIFNAKLKVKVDKPTFEDWVEFVSEVDNRVEGNTEKLLNLEKTLGTALTSLAPHIEEGTISCGDSTNYFGKVPEWRPDAKERDVNVVFNVPFTSPPTVIYGFKYVDIDGRYATRFYHKLRKVTNTGFTFVCGTWSDSRFIAEDLYWYAIKK